MELEGRCAGLCGCMVMEDGDGAIELAYELFPWAWGRGVATTASRSALGLLSPDVREVVGLTQDANVASQRVLERLGFVHVRNLTRFGELQRWYVLERGGDVPVTAPQ